MYPHFLQFINKVSDSSLEVGHNTQRCTSSIQLSNPFKYDGRRIVLFDTPGFDDAMESENEVLAQLAVFLAKLWATLALNPHMA